MQKPSRSLQRAMLPLLGLFIAAGIITGLYFAFRYTLIADVQESLMNVDTTDAQAHGQALFQTRGCAGCHTLDGVSVGDTGPNLTGIVAREGTAYVRESIINPGAVIADNCPEGACEADAMPNYGSILDETQVAAIVTYLESP
ncbi:MAG: hypothetical protein OHK0046_52180 [Anaerolineae bacterium]